MVHFIKFLIGSSLCLTVFTACKEKKPVKKQEPEKIIYKIDTSREKELPAASRAPVINIVDTIAAREIVIYVKDSAKTSDRIGIKLEKIYRKTLPEFCKKNNITITGPRIAWFKSSSAPFYFEAGFPVNKKPAKKSKNIFVREIGGQNVLVAHFYGPYHLSYEAYVALSEQLKSLNKKQSASPYEKYITPPIDSTGKAMDPYKVLTDIVFPHK